MTQLQARYEQAADRYHEWRTRRAFCFECMALGVLGTLVDMHDASGGVRVVLGWVWPILIGVSLAGFAFAWRMVSVTRRESEGAKDAWWRDVLRGGR